MLPEHSTSIIMAKVLAKLLENEKNLNVLDFYSDGWTKVDSTK